MIPSRVTNSPYPEDYLPESGEPPSDDTDVHRKQAISIFHALDDYFRENRLVYVSGGIQLYYWDEDKHLQHISPDIFVMHGVSNENRRFYDLRREGKVPDLIIELTSTNTRSCDLITKRHVYARLGIPEYFIFDPTEIMQPVLQGFRLEDNAYKPMSGSRLHSEALELDLVVEAGQLRFYNAKTGERLRTPEETATALRAEKNARQAVETENARLREEFGKAASSEILSQIVIRDSRRRR